MHFHDFILVGLAYVSEIGGTLSGFGSSTFFVPLALLFETFRLTLALTALLHCFGNFFKVSIFRHHFDRRAFFLLFIPAILFTGIGALLAVHYNAKYLKFSLGIFLIAFSVFSLVGKQHIHRFPKWIAIVLSAVSGFSTGLIGTGGAIRGLALMALEIPKDTFVAVSSAVDLGGDLLRAYIYLTNGFMDWNQWTYIPLLAAAAFAGAKTGQILLTKINQRQFEKVVAVFILASGILMLR